MLGMGVGVKVFIMGFLFGWILVFREDGLVRFIFVMWVVFRVRGRGFYFICFRKFFLIFEGESLFRSY